MQLKDARTKTEKKSIFNICIGVLVRGLGWETVVCYMTHVSKLIKHEAYQRAGGTQWPEQTSLRII